MDVDAPRGLLRFFDELEDPRMDRTKLHSLDDMLFITLCAALAGADSWTEVEVYGNEKLDWLRTFSPLLHGIPSHDTFGRLFSRLNPEQLERGFLQPMTALSVASDGRLIAIDGKTLRRSFDKANGRDAKGMLAYIRGHWGIENKLHWSLDVTFREDTLRNRIGHSAENFSRIRRLALNLLRQDRTCKVGVKGKRLKASLNQDYLLRVIGQGI